MARHSTVGRRWSGRKPGERTSETRTGVGRRRRAGIQVLSRTRSSSAPRSVGTWKGCSRYVSRLFWLRASSGRCWGAALSLNGAPRAAAAVALGSATPDEDRGGAAPSGGSAERSMAAAKSMATSRRVWSTSRASTTRFTARASLDRSCAGTSNASDAGRRFGRGGGGLVSAASSDLLRLLRAAACSSCSACCSLRRRRSAASVAMRALARSRKRSAEEASRRRGSREAW
mmetsp:Transcript_21918/g.86979  ORF Transcript_21918/g.86979 Transcript_21918/m.86979 type:complete len:230 (-) Transcript_21918:1261-1950(-)